MHSACSDANAQPAMESEANASPPQSFAPISGMKGHEGNPCENTSARGKPVHNISKFPSIVLQDSAGQPVHITSAGQPVQSLSAGEPVPQTPSPTKTVLKDENQMLKQQLWSSHCQAHKIFADEKADFKEKAQQFEIYARDVTQVEVATAEAKQKSDFNSEMQHAQSVVQRTSQRLQATSQKVIEVKNEADAALHQQHQNLQKQAEAVIQDQKQKLISEADDAYAQKRDALVVEATQAIEQTKEQVENQAQQHYNQLWSDAQGNLIQKDVEINRLNETLQMFEAEERRLQLLQFSAKGDFRQENQRLQAELHDSNSTIHKWIEIDQEKEQKYQSENNKHKEELKEMRNAANKVIEQRIDMQQNAEEQTRRCEQQITDLKTAKEQATKQRFEATEQMKSLQNQMKEMQQTMMQMKNEKEKTSQPPNIPIHTPRFAEPVQEENEHDGFYGEDWEDEWGQEEYREAYEKEDQSGDQNPKEDSKEDKTKNEPGQAAGETPQQANAGGDPIAKEREELAKLLQELAEGNLGKHKPKYKEADRVHLTAPPNARNVRPWKLYTKKQISSASGRPKEAFVWVAQAEFANSIDELEDDGDFETLSSKRSAEFSGI